jgi:DNA-binding response OmpR family regulator
MKVLLVENENKQLKNITYFLAMRYPQIVISSFSKGLKALEMIETETPDLVMVASSLPDIDILDLISKIRLVTDVPLLILIEGGSDTDRAIVLEAGADDYISKPFSPIELVARVNALLRRTHRDGFKPQTTLSAGDLTINFSMREVSLSGKSIKLTPHEYSLLAMLAQNEGKVLTHHILLEKVWGVDYTGDYSFIKKYIYRLRSKLESDPVNPRIIICERGTGYKFIKPTK